MKFLISLSLLLSTAVHAASIPAAAPTNGANSDAMEIDAKDGASVQAGEAASTKRKPEVELKQQPNKKRRKPMVQSAAAAAVDDDGDAAMGQAQPHTSATATNGGGGGSSSGRGWEDVFDFCDVGSYQDPEFFAKLSSHYTANPAPNFRFADDANKQSSASASSDSEFFVPSEQSNAAAIASSSSAAREEKIAQAASSSASASAATPPVTLNSGHPTVGPLLRTTPLAVLYGTYKKQAQVYSSGGAQNYWPGTYLHQYLGGVPAKFTAPLLDIVWDYMGRFSFEQVDAIHLYLQPNMSIRNYIQSISELPDGQFAIWGDYNARAGILNKEVTQLKITKKGSHDVFLPALECGLDYKTWYMAIFLGKNAVLLPDGNVVTLDDRSVEIKNISGKYLQRIVETVMPDQPRLSSLCCMQDGSVMVGAFEGSIFQYWPPPVHCQRNIVPASKLSKKIVALKEWTTGRLVSVASDDYYRRTGSHDIKIWDISKNPPTFIDLSRVEEPCDESEISENLTHEERIGAIEIYKRSEKFLDMEVLKNGLLVLLHEDPCLDKQCNGPRPNTTITAWLLDANKGPVCCAVIKGCDDDHRYTSLCALADGRLAVGGRRGWFRIFELRPNPLDQKTPVLL